jgi:protein O-GlcNAc transferase
MQEVIDLIQSGRLDSARQILERYLSLHGEDVEARRLLARLVYQLGSPALGLRHLHDVAQKHPRLADLHYEMGVMLIACDRLAEAIGAFERELAVQPGHPGASHNLAWVLRRTGDVDRALDVLGAFVKTQPNNAQAWFNLGNLWMDKGQPEQAAEAYRTALPLSDTPATVLSNLGSAQRELGQFEEACQSFRRALAIQSDQIEAANNLGNVLLSLGRAEEAISVLEAALATHPGDVLVAYNLALSLKTAGFLEQAEEVLTSAAALSPDDARLWNCLGTVEIARNNLPAAEIALGRAIALAPQMAEAHGNLAIVHVDRHRSQEALACFRRAHDLAPDDAAIHSNLLFFLRHLGAVDEEILFAEHRAFGERQERLVTPRPLPPPSPSDAGRVLRIGYVSPDFCEHAVSLFFEPVLEAHDKSLCQIFCYHTGSQTDETTARLKSLSSHWRAIANMSADAAADLIRQDRIDILVDLAGHSAGNGLPIFARKPAPIQATWLGYPGTTGLTRIDYRFSDPVTDPPGRNDEHYTEHLLRLRGQAGFRLPIDAPKIAPPPVLHSGRIRFGSFNKPIKINAEVLTAWSGILQALPQATLLVVTPGGDQDDVQADTRAGYAAHGISPDRIEVKGHRPLLGFLELVASVDIALDTFPYSGATTTMLTLWMGVPVICLAGYTAAASVSSTILEAVGLKELVAAHIGEYQGIATALADDVDRLARLRSDLRPRMARSFFMEQSGMARVLERSYRTLWRHYVEGIPFPRSTAPSPRGDAAQALAQHGRRLVVATTSGEKTSLRLFDGISERPVPGVFSGDQVTPRFSPDGQRLAFAQHDGEHFQIVVADLTTAEAVAVSAAPRDNLMPTWSPDGRALAWHGLPRAHPDLGLDAEIYYWDGLTEPRPLTSNRRMDVYPVFRGSGRSILFHGSLDDGFDGVFEVDLDGNQSVVRHAPPTSVNATPDCVKDTIALTRADAPHLTDYMVGIAAPESDTGFVRLSPWCVPVNPVPRFSPDGDKLACHGPGPGLDAMAIHVLDLSDHTQSKVYGGPHDCLVLPRWSAEGSLIAAEDRYKGTVVLIDATGQITELQGCAPMRGQKFLEIWNFDIH